ncbi:MAG: HAD hydrolase family protein [Opitutae bacterium]|jgi:hydroxymethylpyrimidine pyrophosphatase-like HAD family hydrolase|nr:HAD hydrolase family protein [Opitutae bacterium]
MIVHNVTNPNIKIIFQDIDGCLNPVDGEAFGVTEDWKPSDNQISMLDAINSALNQSSVEHFVINTGRPWGLVRHLAKHFTSPKARYFLVEHACALYDRQHDAYLDCAQIAAANGLNDLVTRYQNLEHIQILFDWYRDHGMALLEAHYQTPLPPVNKEANLSFRIPKGVDGEALLRHIKTIARAQLAPEHIHPLLFLRSDNYIDILPGIHKLDGIHLLTAHLQLDLDQALAVGDYLNDITVFEAFHRVLCPANAHPQIQALTRAKGDFGEVSEQVYGLATLNLLRGIPAIHKS